MLKNGCDSAASRPVAVVRTQRAPPGQISRGRITSIPSFGANATFSEVSALTVGDDDDDDSSASALAGEKMGNAVEIAAVDRFEMHSLLLSGILAARRMLAAICNNCKLDDSVCIYLGVVKILLSTISST